jgi:hypothetical protein
MGGGLPSLVSGAGKRLFTSPRRAIKDGVHE